MALKSDAKFEEKLTCGLKYDTRTVCSYHVTYEFQSESTRYSYLNLKELLAQNRVKI